MGEVNRGQIIEDLLQWGKDIGMYFKCIVPSLGGFTGE